MSPLELLAVFAAVGAGAFVKAVTGMGLPIVAVPVLAAFVGIEDAVVIMSLPGIVANAYLVWRNRAGREVAPPMGWFVVCGAVGAGFGAVLLSRLDETVMTAVLAASVIVYIVYRLRWPDAELSPAAGRRVAPGAGLAAGLFQGAIGVSGPIVVSYVHSARPPRAGHVLAVTGIFFVLGVSQFVSLAALGSLTGDRLAGSAVALVPVIGAIFAGSAVGDRLDRAAFDRAVLATLSVAAVILVVDVV